MTKERDVTNFQSAIFSFDHRQHLFLELTLKAGADRQAALATLKSVGQVLKPELQWVVALGPSLTEDAGFPAFPGFSLEPYMPSSQRDAWVWVQGSDPAWLFDAGQALWQVLQVSFDLALEVPGFFYHDMRDMTGFVDGIGNPQDDQAVAAAIIDEGPAAGGSYLISQLWKHDLKSFHALPVAEQEQVFGRTKADAIEFDDDDMPENAHVGRTDIVYDGVPQKIWRRSVPWGRVQSHGLYFLAFCCDWKRYDHLLKSMVGAEDGIRDRLLDFSKPLTGSYWFAPPANWFH